MFERLSDGFSSALRMLSGKGKLSESNISDAMSQVRTALLEADAAHEVVDQFCQEVTQAALGAKVIESLEPGQQMIGIVHQKLVELMDPGAVGKGPLADILAGRPGPGGLGASGGLGPLGASKTPLLGSEPGAALHNRPYQTLPGMPGMRQGGDAVAGLTPSSGAAIPRIHPGPTIVMMCGLQGSGKTTTCGKLAAYLKKRGRSVMVAAADLQRPAAVEQLKIVVDQVEKEMPGGAQVKLHAEPNRVGEYGKAVGAAVEVCRNAVRDARAQGVDTVILDTAGRLHVNDALMDELKAVQAAVSPHMVLLVADAMTGQDAVNSAKAFHARLNVDGVILTKFDSDTRGGAALTLRRVTGAPIKFLGTGEKLEALEEFHADRVAGRILGMGDVVSLVERAQEQVNERDAEEMAAKMAKGQLTMDDFLEQLRSLRRMGPMKQLLGMLPGVGSMLKDAQIDEKQLDRVEGMVNSMTKAERNDVSLLNQSRRKRIAKGSGVKVEEVSQLVKQFESISRLTKQMAGLGMMGKVKAMKEMRAMAGAGGMPGLGGLPGFSAKGSTRVEAPRGRFKKRR